MRKIAWIAGGLLLAAPVAAQAEPAGEIVSPVVKKGETEFEAVYGRLNGKADDGEDRLLLEIGHGVTDRLELAVRGEIEKEPGKSREFEAVGFEAIYNLGKVGGIDVGLYGEYEAVFEGADKIETKLLLQRRAGPFDAKLNLIAEKELNGEPVEFEYAASADVQALGEFRIGAAAFGELGTAKNFLPRAEHYLGPVVKGEFEGLGPELEFELGYLFALGEARDDSDGQLRVVLEMEF